MLDISKLCLADREAIKIIDIDEGLSPPVGLVERVAHALGVDEEQVLDYLEIISDQNLARRMDGIIDDLFADILDDTDMDEGGTAAEVKAKMKSFKW